MKKNPEEASAEAANPRWAPLLVALMIAACMPMSACSQSADTTVNEARKMSAEKKQIAYFDVALFSYLDRPIFDVYLNGRDIGLAAGQPHSGEANGLMTGVEVKLGEQKITWRLGGPKGMIGNGDTVKAKNTPILTNVDPNFRYLGVHIYPDNTVEIIPERYWPEKTEKGEAINRAWELKHGK